MHILPSGWSAYSADVSLRFGGGCAAAHAAACLKDRGRFWSLRLRDAPAFQGLQDLSLNHLGITVGNSLRGRDQVPLSFFFCHDPRSESQFTPNLSHALSRSERGIDSDQQTDLKAAQNQMSSNLTIVKLLDKLGKTSKLENIPRGY